MTTLIALRRLQTDMILDNIENVLIADCIIDAAMEHQRNLHNRELVRAMNLDGILEPAELQAFLRERANIQQQTS